MKYMCVGWQILICTMSFAQTYQNLPKDCEEDLSQPLSEQRIKARNLFASITGTPIATCDDRLKRIEIYLTSSQLDKAIDVALADPNFYNIRLRDMAAKICSRESTMRTTPNDCIAFIVGFARDSKPLTDLLTANYYYRIDEQKIDVRQRSRVNRNSLVRDMLKGNSHYDQINSHQLSMYHVLKRVDGQMIVDQFDSDRARPAVDPAGVITSRAFMLAHATAGTNRRLVEKSFQQFLCSPITDWSDNTVSDQYVGRDVTRAPGKSPSKYHVTCKGCHAPMDSMRGAFARVDFTNNYFEYNLTGIQDKMNRNADATPDLFFLVMDDRFDNMAIRNSNASLFGWRGSTQGRGMNEFGQMIVASDRFSKCMVQRAYVNLCGRAAADEESETAISQISSDLSQVENPTLMQVYKMVALHPTCLGGR